jgi:hypothetical protein
MFSDEQTRYQKYNTLAWILSRILEKMDIYTRYPRKSMNYLNMNRLMEHNNKKACEHLDEMISELVDLVPLVWKKIRSLSI